jgi:hypothetical protein
MLIIAVCELEKLGQSEQSNSQSILLPLEFFG